MSQITKAFDQLRKTGNTAFIPFLPASYPTADISYKLVKTVCTECTDLLEIGIPFSDPISGGPMVRRASHVGFKSGSNLPWTLDFVHRLRADGVTTPFALMGYWNPFLKFGLERLCQAAGDDIDGLIVPDLPIEEAQEWRQVSDRYGIDLIAAPTSTDERFKWITETTTAFLYCIALKGFTGARESLGGNIRDYLLRLRDGTDLPLLVGFGISEPDHVRSLSEVADEVVIGSALIRSIEISSPGSEIDATLDLLLSLGNAIKREPLESPSPTTVRG